MKLETSFSAWYQVIFHRIIGEVALKIYLIKDSGRYYALSLQRGYTAIHAYMTNIVVVDLHNFNHLVDSLKHLYKQ